MKKKIFALLLATAMCVVCVAAISGCTSSSKSETLKSDTGLTGGVAATVNGAEIAEDKITTSINNMRINYGMTEDDSWKQYLQMTQNTPESMRYMILESYVNQELVKQCADQLGFTASDEDIQAAVDKTKANYSSDSAWETALEEAGYENGEEEYKDKLRFDILNKQIEDKYAEEAEKYIDDDKNLLKEVQDNISTYDGAKKSARILFAAEDEKQAQKVYKQIKDGEISFADAVKKYSTDDATKDSGGDMGWDVISSSSLGTEYTTALADMKKGDVSEPVTSDSGISIITVTDVYKAPKNIKSTKGIPSDFMDRIKSSAKSTYANDQYEGWLASLRGTNEVNVNPMPNNAPYNIDMSDVYSEEEAAKINDKALQELETGVEAEETDTSDAEAENEAAAEEGAEGNTETEGELTEDADATAEVAEAGADAESGAEAEATGEDSANN